MLALLFTVALCADPVPEAHFSEYFTTYRSDNGLVQDRASTPDVFSMAASGFGMDVLAIEAVKGEIPREQALAWIHQALDFVKKTNPPKNRGWLYHFVNHNGEPIPNTEVSTIDTAIFYWGAKQAASRLGDEGLQQKVADHISAIDKDWMIQNSPSGKLMSHGLFWHGDTSCFICCEWNKNSEGVLIYRLFDIPFEAVYDNYGLPLFVYYYPMCFLPQEEFKPALQKAIQYQKDTYGYTGITATDTSEGYKVLPLEYTSPMALYAVSAFDSVALEEWTQRSLSPTTHSHHNTTGWESRDRIGIDEGAVVLLRHPRP